MASVTKELSEYVRKTGINISKMSKETKIPYVALYDSLANEKRDRELRVDEFFTICRFLKINPMDFAESPAEAATVGREV
ncbi:hypothetical protein DXC26_00490 [Clostridiaceae bacterium OM08-6BH]|nr:hypothetical protein DXC26_00490 [Clostridiaceae bacterium OM08-6BH]